MEFLIVGLGNPGKEYEQSRHNVGFETIDVLCRRLGVSLSKETPSSIGSTAVISGHKVLLAKPTTYMNDSGKAVSEIVRRYKLEPSRIVVVHDELDLELGVVKIKTEGGLAGHNGLRSIKTHLKSDGFLRVRIGVGKPAHKTQGANHVLRPMKKSERGIIEIACERAADAVELIVSKSVDVAMLAIHTNQ